MTMAVAIGGEDGHECPNRRERPVEVDRHLAAHTVGVGIERIGERCCRGVVDQEGGVVGALRRGGHAPLIEQVERQSDHPCIPTDIGGVASKRIDLSGAPIQELVDEVPSEPTSGTGDDGSGAGQIHCGPFSNRGFRFKDRTSRARHEQCSMIVRSCLFVSRQLPEMCRVAKVA